MLDFFERGIDMEGYKRRKNTYDVEEKLRNQRKADELLTKEVEEIFIPFLEVRFNIIKSAFPDAKEIVIYVRQLYTDRYEFTTIPETRREVIDNPCRSDNRAVLFRTQKLSNTHGIKALPYTPEWEGWIFPFSKTYP